ncbi:MAG TPA: hypothetical protein VLQ93_01615, partial [Myxococcaceae bacterium]|nr:hypothetical protein [Myxococcaceae bacterium]
GERGRREATVLEDGADDEGGGDAGQDTSPPAALAAKEISGVRESKVLGMKVRPLLHRLTASSLCLLLVSCSATQHTRQGPAGPHELARYALVIEETSDGQVTNSWRPASDFDVTEYPARASGRGNLGGRFIPVATHTSHCAARQSACIDMCTRSPRPIPIEGERYPAYLGSWARNRGHWCQSTCTKFYDMCLRGEGPWAEQSAHEFTTIDSAVDWAKRHRTDILVGTVVVIVGVAFVAVVAGSGGGALVLVPLVVMASADTPAGLPANPRLVEVRQC